MAIHSVQLGGSGIVCECTVASCVYILHVYFFLRSIFNSFLLWHQIGNGLCRFGKRSVIFSILVILPICSAIAPVSRLRLIDQAWQKQWRDVDKDPPVSWLQLTHWLYQNAIVMLQWRNLLQILLQQQLVLREPVAALQYVYRFTAHCLPVHISVALAEKTVITKLWAWDKLEVHRCVWCSWTNPSCTGTDKGKQHTRYHARLVALQVCGHSGEPRNYWLRWCLSV